MDLLIAIGKYKSDQEKVLKDLKEIRKDIKEFRKDVKEYRNILPRKKKKDVSSR